ncbi:MAG: glycosyltransferase [Planctomycetes bacterium]|nr:glycosyltransferase [Planctomycetota bacterium]
MKILYVNVIECNAGWGAEVFVDKGFRNLGHTTHCIDYRKHRDKLHSLFSELPEYDVFLLQRGDYFPIDLIESVRVPRFFWASELVSRCRDQDRLLSSGLFDHIFFRTKRCIETAVSHGWVKRDRCSILLSGFDETIHRMNSDIKRDIDILFVGSITPRRKILLEKLQSNFNVTIANAFGRELVQLFNRSKIVLNIHAEDHEDTETRVFETLGCGSFLLTERLSEENPFTCEHLVEFETFDELCDKVKYYLDHTKERDTIAMRGYAEALARHTYTHRAEEIIRAMSTYLPKLNQQNENQITIGKKPSRQLWNGSMLGMLYNESGNVTHDAEEFHRAVQHMFLHSDSSNCTENNYTPKRSNGNEIIYYIPRWLFPNNIGDSILSASLISPIKKRFPDKTLPVVCDDFLSQIYETNPHVHKVRGPYFDEINDPNYWQQSIQKQRDFISIWPDWHPGLFDLLRQDNNLNQMINASDKNIIICNYLFQNNFHPLDTIDTLPKLYLTNDDIKMAKECMNECTSRYKVCIVVSERRPSEKRVGCSPLRYSEKSWRRFVERLKILLGDVTVFEVGNPINYHIGDYYISHTQHILEFAAVLNEMDIGVLSDGGVHHIFNAIDKKYVLFQAYECNAPEFYLMQANGTFDPSLHQECRFQCHLFSRIMNTEDRSKKCNHACYELDPRKLAEFTVHKLLEKE